MGAADGGFGSEPLNAIHQPAADPLHSRHLAQARPARQKVAFGPRLPEIQHLVVSLSVENDALRKEMKELQRACTALSKENGKLETRLDHSSKRNEMISTSNKGKPQPDHQHAAEQEAQNGFVLPDLNLPADA